VPGLNSTSFAGHTDWRVPNVRELQSIIDHDIDGPAVTGAFNNNCMAGCSVTTCSCTGSGLHWPSTTYVPAPAEAWIVNFGAGEVFPNGKSASYFVRAVRGGSSCLPATGQTTCWDSSGNSIACAGTGQDGDLQKGAALAYTDNGDGTITDNNTGLVWEKKSSDGGIHDKSATYSWASTFTLIGQLNTMNFAGHNDWRVPNVRELESIIDHDIDGPAVTGAFNNNCMTGCTVTTCSCTGSGVSWSSTTYIPSPAEAWVLNFGAGEVFPSGKSNNHFVRAVRGGS
jgi:hypothetical protein